MDTGYRPSLALLCCLLLFPALAGAQSQYSGDRCPLPEGAVGYPIWIEAEGSTVDSADAHAIVAELADSWIVPSRRRDRYTSWENVRFRVPREVPRWADDWKPGARHSAVLELVVGTDGGVREGRLSRGSGDRLFDRSLTTLLEGRLRRPGTLPPGPEDRRLIVRLGEEPAGSALALVRFAAQQRPVRLVPGSFHSGLGQDARQRFAGARATIKYDVTEDGHVRPGSIEVLHSTHEEVTRSITNGLMRARFEPAESNCARVALSVVQNFDMKPGR